MLYRDAVEELVKDQGVGGANLKDQIDALKGKGVDADIVTDLHEARLTGNYTIHQGIVFSADEVEDVAQLITDAVEILYVEPARRAAMRNARAARRGGSATPGQQGDNGST